MATSMQIVFACEDPNALAAFWRLALGYAEEPPPEGYDSWDEFATAMDLPPDVGQDLTSAIDPEGVGPRLLFERAPEPKAARNRVHLDINIGISGQRPLSERKPKVDALAKTLLDEGASQVMVVERGDEYFIEMLDPEGNDFCIQ